MPLVQISIYWSWSTTLHSIWREGRLQPGSPARTLAVLQNLATTSQKPCWLPTNSENLHPGNHSSAARKHFTPGKPRNSFLPKLPSGSREKRASGSFLEMRVLRDFAEGLLLNKQFTAHVNTWCFLSSKLKEVSIPQVGGERCYSSTTSPQLFF